MFLNGFEGFTLFIHELMTHFECALIRTTDDQRFLAQSFLSLNQNFLNANTDTKIPKRILSYFLLSFKSLSLVNSFSLSFPVWIS